MNTEIDNSSLNDLYQNRFQSEVREQRNVLWQTLCKYWIQRYVKSDATVLDLAAGQCEFINNINCGDKIALDINEDVKLFADSDVRIVMAMSNDMREIDDNSVDVVFVSNFFEHLPTKQSFLETLTEIRRILRPEGKLIILQPNIRLLNGEYWDFVDHYLPLTDRTLVEAMSLVKLNVDELKVRFLPYTTKSRLPQHPLIVRLYLAIPVLHWMFGKQTWMVASKPSDKN